MRRNVSRHGVVEAIMDLRSLVRSTTFPFSLLLIGTLAACCPQPECRNTADGQFLPCVFEGDDAGNSGKPHVNFGDSVAVGGWCSGNCGYIGRLEQLTSTEIANFGIAGHTAEDEVNGGFARVDESMTHNPGATRAYIHIGGNDLQYWIRAHTTQAPLPADGCAVGPDLQTEMEETVAYVRQIAQRYRVDHGVAEVVIGSVHPVEEAAQHKLSCQAFFKNWGCDPTAYECLNELLELYSDGVQAMVDSLGGPAAGYHFADHFQGFAADPPECSISCDCVHLNCCGHDTMADIWYAAAP